MRREEGRPPARSWRSLFLQMQVPVPLPRAGGRSAPVAVSPCHARHQHRGLSGPLGQVPPAIPALASCLWAVVAAVSDGGAQLAHTASPKLRRVPAEESHCCHAAVGPVAISLTPSSLRPQHSSPLLPAHGCRVLGLLEVPGYAAGAAVVSISPWKHLPLSFLPANMRTVTRAAIQSASLIKIAAHPSSYLLITLPAALLLGGCCVHRGRAALLPIPLALMSRWAAPARSEMPALMHCRTVST